VYKSRHYTHQFGGLDCSGAYKETQFLNSLKAGQHCPWPARAASRTTTDENEIIVKRRRFYKPTNVGREFVA
jgi:hypothetical protein